MEINPASASPIDKDTSSRASDKFNEDFNSFLQLLTAQLKNQDPTAPMDSTQFVTQLTQLSQVEQSIKSNQNLENILNKLKSASSKSDIAMLGKDVNIKSDKFKFNGDEVDFSYKLNENAHDIKLNIKDTDGNIVQTISNTPQAANTFHQITWDGFNSRGNQVATGVYNIEISAKTKDGVSISSETITKANIEEVNLEGTESELLLDNGSFISNKDILRVS